MSLKNTVIASVLLLTVLSIILFIQHEYRTLTNSSKQIQDTKVAVRRTVNLKGPSIELLKTNVKFIVDHISPDREVDTTMLQKHIAPKKAPATFPNEKRGKLVCNGQSIDSEMNYWKIITGDKNFESPFTPHHKNHDDRYLSFEYDHGGWNNGRLGYESLVVLAHAMGRTLVVPPQQHLYLMALNHKDKDDLKEHDEMGFLDFYDINLMRTQKGFHVMEMPEFLAKEGITGGLHNRLPPQNSTQAWGKELWKYLAEVADETPAWFGKFMMFPSEPGDLDMVKSTQNDKVIERLRIFGGERFNQSDKQMTYNRRLQEAHHIHIRGDDAYRILQHHYAFAFFADPAVQSFYKRFVRDYMRYNDEIQCAAKEVVDMIREDAKKLAPHDNGNFYTLHIRRGDFQFKWVKHGAEKILSNLRFPNGTSIIPPGSMVYIATDDPDGVCFQCLVERKSCDTYEKGKKPVGCPEDPSWDAFLSFGWKLRFLRDYLARAPTHSTLKSVNPNAYGMVECLICSRGVVFAGTYMSTFTGYIHRVRGYHGLGEDTYYHTSGHVFMLQQKQKGGHGWTREFRTGWTDDGGELI